jgi:hypothetical protein
MSAVLEGTPTPRSYLRRDDVYLPKKRAVITARRGVAVDNSASTPCADFRRVGSDTCNGAISETETIG